VYNCPHCDSRLNKKLVKHIRPDGRKWYQYSSEPFFKKVCSLCEKEVVVKYHNKWFYNFGLPVILLPNLVISLLGIELTIILKVLLSCSVAIGFFITYRQNRDFHYITPKEEENEKIKDSIKYAKGYFEKPIESSEYCQKYSIEKVNLDNLVSKGLIQAYAINGIDYFEDEAPNYET